MSSPAVRPNPAPDLAGIRHRMHGEDRKRQLLRIAIESFARQGFGGTKTKDIAAAAGVSEAILFRHFATKEDLYHAILDIKGTRDGASQRLRELEALAARRDDRALLRHLALQLVQSFREDPAFHRLLLYAGLEGHLIADLFRQRFALPTGDFLRRYIALRQKEGAFRKCDPRVAVMFFFGSIVQYAMARHLFHVKAQPLEDATVTEELVELVLGGLLKAAGESKGKAAHAKKD
ncbi:MAG TPA: helix-turn-helix domain-containing protein [Bryobacteraceae bacterium]|nr:helix-turn-helix domain-containing protein [Bryobacteraceae bacterium]